MLYLKKFASFVALTIASLCLAICIFLIIPFKYDFAGYFRTTWGFMSLSVLLFTLSHYIDKSVSWKPPVWNSNHSRIIDLILKNWFSNYALTKDFFATYEVVGNDINIACTSPKTLKGCMDINVQQNEELIESKLKKHYNINVLSCTKGNYLHFE